MEQKEILEKLYMRGASTLGKTMEALGRTLSDETKAWVRENLYKPLEGEVGTYEFLNREKNVQVVTLNDKVDLEKLKEELSRHNVAFSFEQTDEGTLFYFRAKDERTIELASKAVLEEIVRDPEKAVEKYGQKGRVRSFEEKLAETKAQMARKPDVKEPVVQKGKAMK